jgi:hypothetical protein
MVRPCPYVTNAPPSLALLQEYFPDAKRPPPSRCFEFAIAVAGGVSTGGYLAGVFDFLIEALDEFEAAQTAHPATTPTHKVKLVNLTGTSAGGLSAALAATCLLKDVPHVYDGAKWTALVNAGLRSGAQTPQFNPLYTAWVQLVDLEGLLAAPTDVETEISVLAPLPDKIAGDVLAMLKGRDDRTKWPNWAARPLDLRLVFGNLRGVPFALNFDNVPNPKSGERLALHRDHVAFSVSPDGADGAPDSWSLGGNAFNSGWPAWKLFQAAAVASSAIPGVFAPEAIRGQSLDVYTWRDCWWDSQLNAPVIDQPFWQTPPPSLDFTATDGGLFDNEPFDLAHRILAGANNANPRPGSLANRAVILMVPFVDDGAGDPNDPVLPPPPPPPGQPPPTPTTPLSRLFSAAWRIFNSPIEQSRWDAFDLALVKSEDVYSRFMIAPTRENPNTASPIKTLGPSRSLMSWPLNLGLGFAAEAYRRHDYLLGRRNAQRFLSDNFMLPGVNSIISPVDPWEETDKRPGPDGSTLYPIIPLRGAVHQRFEEPLPFWNWLALTDDQISKLTDLFGGRVDNAWQKIKASINNANQGSLLGQIISAYLWPLWLVARCTIVGWFKDQLTTAKNKLDPTDYPPP